MAEYLKATSKPGYGSWLTLIESDIIRKALSGVSPDSFWEEIINVNTQTQMACGAGRHYSQSDVRGPVNLVCFQTTAAKAVPRMDGRDAFGGLQLSQCFHLSGHMVRGLDIPPLFKAQAVFVFGLMLLVGLGRIALLPVSMPGLSFVLLCFYIQSPPLE